jgi:tRNA/rRNA methyltransferase
VLSHPEAIALASGATDVLEKAVIVSTIQEALLSCDLAAAVSARLREFSPPVIDPRQFAEKINMFETGNAALILGNERYGLPNEIVEKCNYLITIPANPSYSSLNLAQAVQVLAYECRYNAQLGNPNLNNVGFKGESASLTDIDAMFEHLEQGLVAIKFIDPAHPKKLMPRLKRLFARTQLETEEINILRGIAKKMLDK